MHLNVTLACTGTLYDNSYVKWDEFIIEPEK